MADPKRQAAFEELMRRGVIQTPEQRAAVAELSRRGLLRTTPYASFTSPKPPAAAATKPAQTAKPKGTAKPLDTSYRGTGASISAKPEPNLFERGLEALTAPFAKVDEMAAQAILESGGASKEAEERYRKLGRHGLRDLPFWERIDPEMIRGISQTPVIGGIARFGLGLATPSALIPIGGALAAIAKGLKAAKVVKVAAGALGAGAVYGGSRQVKQGIEARDVNTAVEGGLNVLLGALTLRTLRQWQADTGVTLTPQQEKVILQAPPKNRPNIAKRFVKIQEARAKDVPTRMPPVTPTPVEAAPVPAKTAKGRKTRRPATSEPIPAVGDNQPLGNEAVAPQPAPVGSAGRGDVALPAEPLPTPQAEAVPPVQRGLEAGAEAAPEAPLKELTAQEAENGLHTVPLADFLLEAAQRGLDLTDAMRMHKAAVQQALDAGLPVDKEVLKPYPGLKKSVQEPRFVVRGEGVGIDGKPSYEIYDTETRTVDKGYRKREADAEARRLNTESKLTPNSQVRSLEFYISIGQQGTRLRLKELGFPVENAEGVGRSNVPLSELESFYAQLSQQLVNTPDRFTKKKQFLQEGLAFLDRIIEYGRQQKGGAANAVPIEETAGGLLRQAEAGTGAGVELPGVGGENRPIETAGEGQAPPAQVLPQVDPNLDFVSTFQNAGSAIVDNMYKAWRESVRKTGKLPPQETNGLPGQVWQRLMDAGFPASEATFNRFEEQARQGAFTTAEKAKAALLEWLKPVETPPLQAPTERLPEGPTVKLPKSPETPTAKLPEVTLPKAAKPDAPKPTGNAAQPSLRHRDMQAIAEELGVALAPKVKESWRQVTDRAMNEYDSILDSLKHYDPDTSPTPSDEEKIVAGARIREIQRELNPLFAKKANVTKEEAARITALELESGQLLNLATKAGSGNARSLNLQKILLPDDPTDPAAVLLRAQRLAGGELGIPARRTLTRLAEEAKAATEAAEAKVIARRPREVRKTQEKTFGQENTVFTKEKYEAAQARLREKLGRASVSIDPTMLSDLVEIGGYYFEGGLRQFSAWARQVKQDLPELNDDDIKLVWRSLQTRARTEKLLSRLGTVEKRPAALLDEATLTYAKGARDLHRFAAALRKKHGGQTFTEAELTKLFREAVEQYHKDFRQVEAIKRRMTEVVAQEVYRQKPWYGKIWHGAKELNNLSRSLILGPDISFLMRQGGPLVANRPIRMNKAVLPEMWRALQREEVAQAIDASIRYGKKADIYEKAGLDFSDIEPGTKPGHEEGIASDWLEKVPGIRRPYRAADRANTVLINKIRAETFDLLYDPQKHNIEQAKAIARYINVATGRGDLSNAAIAGLVRGTADVFLSPRYMVSRFQYLMGLPLWKAPKGARKLIAQEYINYYLRVGAFLTLASQLPGVDVEADPRSSDFGTIRIGNLNIDILSGLKQPITAGARIATGQNYLSDEGKAIPSDPFRTFLNFFLYKMSPLPQLGADMALRQGKDFKGDPLTVGGVSRRLFLNITLQDVVETLLEKGIDPKTALELGGSALVSQVGVGANLRDRAEEAKKRAKKAETRKEAAREKNRVDRIIQRLTDPIVPNVPNGVLVGPGTF